MKYTIVQISGKQFLIKSGEWYDIDFIPNGKIGDFISFNKILLYRKRNKLQLGTPFLSTNKIFAKIIQQVKNPKITILKTKPKKKYTRIKGHRQLSTRIQIN